MSNRVGSSRLRHTSGVRPRITHTAPGGDLRGKVRRWPAAPAFRCRHGRAGWLRSWQRGAAVVPGCPDGTREGEHRGRTQKPRCFHYHEVAPERTDPASSAKPVRVSGRQASVTEATHNVAWSCSEKPGVPVKREHLAIPFGMSPDRSPQGRPAPRSPSQGRQLSIRPPRGRPFLYVPASCDARAD